MEAKLVELVAAKVAPLVFAESTNAYSKHVEKKKTEQIEAGKTAREALGVTHNIVSTMGREIEPMANLSEQREYEEMFVKSDVREARMEIIKNSEDLSSLDKEECMKSIEKEEREMKEEAAKIIERKELRKFGCNMATISLVGTLGITALKIVFGGGNVAMNQNVRGNSSAMASHSNCSHKHISGTKYNTPRLASR